MTEYLRLLLVVSCLVLAACGEGASVAAPADVESLSLSMPVPERQDQEPKKQQRPAPLDAARAANVRRELKRIMRDLPANATATVAVQDPGNDVMLFEHDVGRALIPASNTKLFTGAAAMVDLGLEFIFTTPFIAPDGMSNGRVRGDLHVRGAGDPSMSRRFLNDDPEAAMAGLAALLVDAGVRSIEGGVVGDGSLFSGPTRGEAWPKDPAWRRWMAEPGALVFNDNYVEIACSVAKGRSMVRAVPDVGHVTFENALRVTSELKSHSIAFSRPDKSNRFRVSGKVYAKSSGYRDNANIHDGTLYFARGLDRALRNAGVKIGKPASRLERRRDGRQNQVIASFTSRLMDSLPTMLGVSQNLYAEMYHRRLGVEAGHGGTFKGGAKAVRAFLEREGILEGDTKLVDGSGLSRANRVSARQIIKLLRRMAQKTDHRAAFRNGLPTPGSGTLSRRMSGLSGRLHAKTGTLNRVSALSGYIKLKSGQWLRFASVFNKCNVKTARALQNRICQALARI